MKKKLTGVSEITKKDGTLQYRSSLTYKNRHISLGTYPDSESAHCAYLEAFAILNHPELTIASFDSTHFLKFEKWVSMINLRDNGIYFANPIYLRSKVFYYYFSPTEMLKFDIDDLFYYSSHKIMRRGGHLFVADYGSQLNILNRYGIKSYAVEGRDYRFVNGDSSDFRYINIEIINQYHGVYRFGPENNIRYRAKIHINGDYIVGTYDTPEHAAIAYNKAADTLQQNGVQIRYTLNYIDSLLPSEYAEIYSQIKISQKIRHFRPAP